MKKLSSNSLLRLETTCGQASQFHTSGFNLYKGVLVLQKIFNRAFQQKESHCSCFVLSVVGLNSRYVRPEDGARYGGEASRHHGVYL